MTMPDQTATAPVDALLLAQARWRDDHEAAEVVAKYSDPWATSRQLADWLRVAVQKALGSVMHRRKRTRGKFQPPSRPGRCTDCGWHVESMGHADDCSPANSDGASA